MKAKLPMNYDNYVFDLYGTLVDIRTVEDAAQVWEKLALFYGYYGAIYEAEELQREYGAIIKAEEAKLKMTLESDPHYAHEASPEIEIQDVFALLYRRKNVEPEASLVLHTAQLFRVLTTEYVRLYEGTIEMLQYLKKEKKKIYLLSNAQYAFTAYELKTLEIFPYFDDILISSEYQTKKPDARFFDLLIQRHHLDVDKSIYVGNDSRNDVLGAQGVGMHTYYVQSNISPQGDRTDLAEYNVENFTMWNY